MEIEHLMDLMDVGLLPILLKNLTVILPKIIIYKNLKDPPPIQILLSPKIMEDTIMEIPLTMQL